jgi:hypothetical protein
MKILKSFLIISFCLFLISEVTYCQYPNFRIYPSNNHQIEPAIVQHPSNPQIMFASAFTIYTSFRSEGVYVSTNGGLNWRGTDTCTGFPIVNHGGDPGPIIDKDGRFILTHQGGFVIGMFSNSSANMGASWSNNLQIAANDQDKGNPVTDDVSSSPYYGRTYLMWTRFTMPFPIVFSYTTNSGQSWIAYTAINSTPSGHYSQGPFPSVGPQGNIYVSWASSILISPFTEDFIGFASSSNGGAVWNVRENIYDCNGIRSASLQPWNIRVNGYPSMDIDKSGGSRNGWIYIVTAEKDLSPAGSDPDIVFHRSTNGGVNWSLGIRVNQDQLNNGKIQFIPFIRVDEGGGINVIYFDNRNISSDSCEVFLSRSDDGGNTWNDYLISSHRFKPKSVSGAGAGNQGDNIGMTSANGKLLPVWMDDHTGVYQVWIAIVDYTTIGVKNNSNEIPARFELRQNYPNPFNPETRIVFYIPAEISDENIELTVYDILGNKTRTLVNNKLSPGQYEVVFDGTYLPSGIYLYRLTSNGYFQTKKMVLVK